MIPCLFKKKNSKNAVPFGDTLTNIFCMHNMRNMKYLNIYLP